MRAVFDAMVEKGRVRTGPYASAEGEVNGIFHVRHPRGAWLKIMSGSGLDWDHVSVSTKGRCPTWQEMDWIKRLFFSDDEVAVQYHVAVQDHINCHPYCLHMWRPHDRDIPLPPKEAV